ncbi:MAG: ExeA family protein [Burkholderiales bacterium]
MYESFYRLTARPFSIDPDPNFLYFSRRHKVALNLLEYGLSQLAGFNVVTGPIGTGKTTLIRYLLARNGANMTIGLIANMHVSTGGMLPRILLAFRQAIDSASDIEHLRIFTRFLEQQAAGQHRAVLIVDEAQSLSLDALEELRMLSNLNAELPVFQVILAGQPALKEKLCRPELEQFAQRVVVDYELQPLDKPDTACYIAHRTRVAGHRGALLFNAGACDAVYHYSGGVPRVINILCETALVYGFSDRKPGIDAQVIHEVAGDRRDGGILPLRGFGAPVN